MLRHAGFRQATKVIHYCLIVAAAWAAATVVVKLAGIDLHPKIQTRALSTQEGAQIPKGKHGADDAVILKRNIFGAADVDVAAEEVPAAGAADLRLRGLAVSAGRSFAVFENTASAEQNVFSVGDRIFDGPKLVSIDAAGADVLLKGKKRRYEIHEDDDGALTADGDAPKKGSKPGSRRAAAKAAKSGKPEKSAKGDKKSAAASGVKKTGESAYLVDRREVEHAVANLNDVITQARAVPVMTDGKSSGFKLFNIRPGSIFEKIGLVDGDVVQRVNDTELSDPSKAIGLLEEIQSMSQIRVNFSRSGKLHSNTYTIR